MKPMFCISTSSFLKRISPYYVLYFSIYISISILISLFLLSFSSSSSTAATDAEIKHVLASSKAQVAPDGCTPIPQVGDTVMVMHSLRERNIPGGRAAYERAILLEKIPHGGWAVMGFSDHTTRHMRLEVVSVMGACGEQAKVMKVPPQAVNADDVKLFDYFVQNGFVVKDKTHYMVRVRPASVLSNTAHATSAAAPTTSAVATSSPTKKTFTPVLPAAAAARSPLAKTHYLPPPLARTASMESRASNFSNASNASNASAASSSYSVAGGHANSSAASSQSESAVAAGVAKLDGYVNFPVYYSNSTNHKNSGDSGDSEGAIPWVIDLYALADYSADRIGCNNNNMNGNSYSSVSPPICCSNPVASFQDFYHEESTGAAGGGSPSKTRGARSAAATAAGASGSATIGNISSGASSKVDNNNIQIFYSSAYSHKMIDLLASACFVLPQELALYHHMLLRQPQGDLAAIERSNNEITEQELSSSSLTLSSSNVNANALHITNTNNVTNAASAATSTTSSSNSSSNSNSNTNASRAVTNASKLSLFERYQLQIAQEQEQEKQQRRVGTEGAKRGTSKLN